MPPALLHPTMQNSVTPSPGWFVTLAFCACACACARQHTTPYKNERAQAERHYAHGRYSEAASSWRRAAGHAEHRDDRVEALYRSAAAHERARNIPAARAAYVEVLKLAPRGSRAARAAFELAWLDIEQGRTARGERGLLEVMLIYQDSALAGRAFTGLASRRRAHGGDIAVLALIEQVRPKIEQPELAEQVRYAEGRLLRTMGQEERALRVFLELADQFPYPQGAYWEDALWHAADIERARGRPQAALTHLERMLAEVEPAHFQGSYARTRYAEAQYRIAEIYRDDLAQPDRARAEFRKVFDEHPTSLLRDDALWQEALISWTTGERAVSCTPLARLIAALPDSRYAPCAPLLCDRLPSSDRSCRPYIRRTFEVEAAPTPAAGPNATLPGQSSK